MTKGCQIHSQNLRPQNIRLRFINHQSVRLLLSEEPDQVLPMTQSVA